MANRSDGNHEPLERNRFAAYPDLDPSLEVVIRFQEIKRWHMVDMTPTQNLASHSATVALLAGHITHTCPGLYLGASRDMIVEGLIHDIGETMTGDIPGHVKEVIGDFPKMLETQLTPNWLRPSNDRNIRHLIKLCDLAEAVRYAKIRGVTRVASWAADQLRKSYSDALAKAEADWPDIVVHHVDKILCDFMDVR